MWRVAHRREAGAARPSGYGHRMHPERVETGPNITVTRGDLNELGFSGIINRLRCDACCGSSANFLHLMAQLRHVHTEVFRCLHLGYAAILDQAHSLKLNSRVNFRLSVTNLQSQNT